MPTLYVSDLDGTLLRSDETTSNYTNDIINRLVEQGMLFSYATARSYITARKVTKGLAESIPVIVYNGTMVIDGANQSFLVKNFFDESVQSVLDDLLENGVYPIVYSFIQGHEKFSYVPDRCTRGMKLFLDSRKGDVRTHAVSCESDLRQGEIFYITCIDEEDKLRPLYERYKDKYHCVFARDIYSNEQWFEMMPKEASKSHAIKQLQEKLGCDKVVVFGDGINDRDMFEMADEAYAVSNAVDELKKVATAIIGSNNEDGVARWLKENVKCK